MQVFLICRLNLHVHVWNAGPQRSGARCTTRSCDVLSVTHGHRAHWLAHAGRSTRTLTDRSSGSHAYGAASTLRPGRGLPLHPTSYPVGRCTRPRTGMAHGGRSRRLEDDHDDRGRDRRSGGDGCSVAPGRTQADTRTPRTPTPTPLPGRVLSGGVPGPRATACRASRRYGDNT